MKLLLDTHILLWSVLEPDKLSTEVKAELEHAHNELWLSPHHAVGGPSTG